MNKRIMVSVKDKVLGQLPLGAEARESWLRNRELGKLVTPTLHLIFRGLENSDIGTTHTVPLLSQNELVFTVTQPIVVKLDDLLFQYHPALGEVNPKEGMSLIAVRLGEHPFAQGSFMSKYDKDRIVAALSNLIWLALEGVGDTFIANFQVTDTGSDRPYACEYKVCKLNRELTLPEDAVLHLLNFGENCV